MMRVKVPGGNLNSPQMRTLADIARDYGHGMADITTRQTFQFHWFEIQQMPDILGRLDAVEIATAGACGDIARNVTGCPVAGLAHDELFDVRPTIQALHEFFLEHAEEYRRSAA